MAYLNDTAFDSGLSWIDTTTTTLYICSAEPATYAEASSTYKLGTKTTPTVSAAQAGSPNGRQVTISAISDGTVNTTGTASHWALTSGSVLVAAGSLSSSVAVTSGHTFTLASFTIRYADPT